MFTITLSGRIGSLKAREGANGDLLIMRVAAKVSRKSHDGQWADETIWCEAVASGPGIERWSKYKVGDAVEMSGRGDIDVYVPQNGGEPRVTVKLFGHETGTPSVRWTPSGARKDDEADSGGRDAGNGNGNGGGSGNGNGSGYGNRGAHAGSGYGNGNGNGSASGSTDDIPF